MSNNNSRYFADIMQEEYNPVKDHEVIRGWIREAQKGYDKKTRTFTTDESIEERNKVIKANLRLVPYVVNKIIQMKHYLYFDCINEGSFALSNCVANYDTDSKTSCATYAQTAIERHMWRFMREHFNTVKLSAQEVTRRKKQEDEVYESGNALDRLYKMDFEPINYIRSLDYSYGDGTQANDVPVYLNASSILNDKESRDIALRSLECLSDRERVVINNRFLGDKKVILKDISEIIGTTTERVRQIEKFALKKMRNWIEEHETK